MNTNARLSFCLGLLFAGLFSASASDRSLHFPFHGEQPFGTPLEQCCLRDVPGLMLRNGGVLFGKGLVAPEVLIDGWRGEQGTVAFWIKSVDWLASTREHVVFLKAIEPKQGGFLIYKYYTGDKIWFYGTQPKASKRRRVRIHFAYEGIKNWQKDEWHHLAFSWRRGSFAKLFVDGKLVGSTEGSFFFPESMAGITFGQGGKKPSMGGKVQSVMRDLYVATGPLSDVEVRLLSTNRPSQTGPDDSVFRTANVFPFPLSPAVPVIDGKISAEEYPAAFTGLVATDRHTAYPDATRFCTAANHESLFLAAAIELPRGYAPQSVAARRDDAAQIAKGDLFCVFIRSDADVEKKVFQGWYFTIAPNGNLYDALEEIDWAGMSCQRRAEFDAKVQAASVVSDGSWTIELRVDRESLGLGKDVSFSLSAGFKLGNQRITIQDHAVWFDHYQAFSRGVLVPVGVQSGFGDLSRGNIALSFLLRNFRDSAISGEASCSVAIPDIRETAAGMVVEKEIGQEIAVRTERTIHQRRRHFQAGPRSQTVVEESLELEDPGTYLLLAAVEADKQVIYRQAVPFVYSPPLVIDLKPVPDKDRIKASLSLYGAAEDGAGKVNLVFISSSSGKAVLTQSLKISGKSQTNEFSMSPLPPGKYKVQATLLDKSGARIAERTLAFEKWETPSWLKERKGLAALDPDWVPAPWTPLRTDDHEVSLWGKSFAFSAGGLLSGMTSQGVALLAGGVSVKFLRDGREYDFRIDAPDFAARNKGRVRVSQTGQAPGLSLAATQQIEFDGMDRFDLTILPKEATRVDKLWVEIPFADVLLFHASCSGSGEHGLIRDVEYTGLPHLWVGNDKAGCVFFAESCKGWLVHSQKPRVTLKTAGSVTTLRLLIVNEPSEVNSPLVFTFGLHATPVKPLFEGWRAIRPQGWGWTPPPTNLYMAGPTVWMSSYSVPAPRNWQVLEVLVAHVRKHGQTVYPYLTPFNISMHDMVSRDVAFLLPGQKMPAGAFKRRIKDSRRIEAYWYFAEDWNLNPPQFTGDGSARETSQMACVSPSSSWTDYFVGSVHEILKRSDIDGFYFDLASPRINFDESKGFLCKSKDGVLEGTREYFAARDLYKRLYCVFDELRGPERKPYILGHGSAAHMPLSSFWDINFHGEGVKPKSKFEVTELFLQKRLGGYPIARPADPDAERSWDALAYRGSSGPQFGLPIMYLPQYSRTKGLSIKEHSRELLAWTFPHNNFLWPAYIPAGPVHEFWKKVEIPFGMGDTSFFPYWDNGVNAQPECIKVSYWKKAGKDDYLLAAANWSGKAEPARIPMPARLRSFSECADVETGERIPVKDSVLLVAIPHHDLRVFRFGGKGKE